MYEAEDYDGYFLWLCSLVNADMTRYSELLWILQDTDFVWVLELDESRAVDGLDLRREYVELSGEDWVTFWERGCTVLEMLIAFARRIEGIMGDVNTGDRTRVWFWEMLRNLGLKPYSNIRMEYEDSRENDILEISMILSRWMNREFDCDGVGSVFPLRVAMHDQRERTLVYQMYDYIFENYPE